MSEHTRKLTMSQIRKLKSLSNKTRFEGTTEKEIDRQIANDPELDVLTDEELLEFQIVRRLRDD